MESLVEAKFGPQFCLLSETVVEKIGAVETNETGNEGNPRECAQVGGHLISPKTTSASP